MSTATNAVVKRPLKADLAATARVINDEAERRGVLPHIARNWKRADIDNMVASSPRFEVTIDGPAG